MLEPGTPNEASLKSEVQLQGYLTKLDMGNLVTAGMLSVNVLFSNDIQVRPKTQPFSLTQSQPNSA